MSGGEGRGDDRKTPQRGTPSRGARKTPARSAGARPAASTARGGSAPRGGAQAARGGAGARVAKGGSLAALIAGFDRGEFPRSLYLDGPSEPAKAAILADLRWSWAAKHADSPPARVLRVAESGIDEILAAAQGGSLFAVPELTVVLEIEDLGKSEKKVAALAGGLERTSDTACLVLVESEGDSVRKTLEPLRAACSLRIACDTPTHAELLAWGARRLRQQGLTVEPGVIETVVESCENDALAFFSELARLTAFAAPGKPIARRDAEALLQPAVGAVLPQYLAAIGEGDEALACRRLGRLLAAGENEGSILWALTNLVGGALGGWAKNREASWALGRRLGRARLMRAMDAMYRAESAWKSGRADAVAVLEQATRVLARR